MKNREELVTALNILRVDNTQKQKRGIHFILASVVIWIAILLIQLSPLPIMTKNIFSFYCSAPLVPLALLASKILKIDFQNKGNPFSNLGLLISLNQMLYILIAMWVCAAVPEKMLMVYAMIFGAHLLPYGWSYQSKTYYVLAVFIPIAVLAIGIYLSSVAVAIFMLCTEIVFCILLTIENHKAFSKDDDIA